MAPRWKEGGAEAAAGEAQPHPASPGRRRLGRGVGMGKSASGTMGMGGC